VTVGSQVHAQMVGAGVLRTQGTLTGEPVWSAAEFSFCAAPSTPAKSSEEGWSRTSTRCTPRRRRMLSRAANSNIGSSTARASTCSAYTRERRRTRARFRRCSSTWPSARMSHVARVGMAPLRRDCRIFRGLHGGRPTCTGAKQQPDGRLDRQFYARLCAAPCRPPLPRPAGHQLYFVQHEATVSGFYRRSFKDHPCIAHQHGGRVTRIDNTRHVLLIKVRMDDGVELHFWRDRAEG
jgi:hypothetical protein